MAAIATGILVSRFAAFDRRELLTVIAAFLFLAIISLLRHSHALAGACCLLALLFSGILTTFAHQPGPRPELDVEGRAPVILSGCVVVPPAFYEGRQQFVLELEPGARVRVSLYLREGEQPPPLQYGQHIELEARVRRTRNFANPGSFDYARYLARQDIYWTASASSASSIQALAGRCGSTLARAMFALRTAGLERLEQLYRGQPYNIGMMQAILLGETSKLEKVWTEHFRSTGTFHALVISGTHVAVLAAFLLFLLRMCLIPRNPALLLTVLASWLYAVITGWQAPVIRSAAGFTLFVIGGFFYRERRLMNILAAVAIGFLVLDPEQMFEASLQLSFLSVACIALFAVPLIDRTSGPLARGLSQLGDTARDLHLPPRVAQFRVEMRLLAETVHLWTRLPEKLARPAVSIIARSVFYIYELMIVSAVVQIGLALPMAIYFHRVSFSGLSANAFVVPLMGLVVPAGFAAMLTGWTLPAKIAGGLLWASQVAVDWHAQWEPNWRIPAPPLWLSISFTAALIAVALLGSARLIWRACAIASVLALLVLLVWSPFPALVSKGRLELTAIDVGQGDSILLAMPDGKLILIDGGGIPMFGRRVRSRLDIGEDVVSPYLWSRSIRRLDVIALTHAHEDHIGGLAALLDNFHVQELWTGAMPESPSWNALRAKALARGVKILSVRRGRRFDYGGASIEALSPAADYQPGHAPRNNDSLALRVRFVERCFLLTGDIERQIEQELVAQNLIGKADVLKIAHHGSRTSSTSSFLETARPAFAIISVGFENSYGHPNREVLGRLEAQHAAVFRTDLYGLVSISTDGRRLKVDTYRWSSAGASPEPALAGFF